MCLLAGPVSAEDGCRSDTTRLSTRATVNVRIDNDMFGGMGQDQGYSNGFLVSAVSPNLADYTDDPCLPRPARRLNRHLAWLQPDGFDEQNMIFGVGQLLYTPTDRNRTDLIADDRPYAAALLLSFGYNARKGDRLRTTQLRLGMVGPSAFGEQVQNRWHDVIGSDRFDGWDHQLRDEPVLQLIHERRKRLGRRETPGGWGWDLTRHWGGSLGNFATYANVGGEWRFGARLPDDFGTAPLRPAGENTSPVKEVADRRWHGRFALARYHRTREFDGQEDIPVYGTFTIGRHF